MLRKQPEGLESLGSASAPLYGFTDVDIKAVGAYRVGSLASEDPQAPGVLVLEGNYAGERSILLRLGSIANQRDLRRYDGAYTVLEVQVKSPPVVLPATGEVANPDLVSKATSAQWKYSSKRCRWSQWISPDSMP